MLRHWISAARLRTLPLALSSSWLAAFIAYSEEVFKLSIFVLATLTTVLLQVLSNFANDLGDFQHGTDDEKRLGPIRATQSGAITPGQMKKAVIITAIITLLTGLVLVIISVKVLPAYVTAFFVLLGLLAIAAAVKYTMGKSNYGYAGLGDLFVFIFFGLVGVAGTYFLYANLLSEIVVLPAIAVGMLSAGVLNLNNMRDIENDAAHNKRTIPVRIGLKAALLYHVVLVFLPVLVLIKHLLVDFNLSILILSIIPIALLLMHLVKILTNPKPDLLNKHLKILSLTTFAYAICYGVILNLV